MSSEEEFSLVSEPRSSSAGSPQGPHNTTDFEFDHQMFGPDYVLQNHQVDLYRANSTSPTALEEKDPEKERLDLLLQEEQELLRKISSIQVALVEEDRLQKRLHQLTEVLPRAPELNVKLGLLTTQTSASPTFDMKSHVVYPMDGGTALITFEEEDVAKKVVRQKQHTVSLGQQYRTTLEARPVQLLVPKSVELDCQICSHQVLVSNLPQMDVESLEDKLGFHFSKKANGGGEVTGCHVQEDAQVAELTFAEEGVADALVLKPFHELVLKKSTQRISVTPRVRAEMSRLETQLQVCSRTVLLTGIPDFLDQEVLQDLLVAHFQRPSNGGGEVLECLYNPLGHSTTALFTGQSNA